MNQLGALALTLLCETPVILWLARVYPKRRVLLAALSASSLTHPVAWHVGSLLSPVEYRSGLAVIETLVVLFEALWYWIWLRPRWPLALIWSLTANAVSFGVGVVWMWCL